MGSIDWVVENPTGIVVLLLTGVVAANVELCWKLQNAGTDRRSSKKASS
jgi:hypothetical protein